MNERRIARLEQQIKARVAEVISHDISDPRRGLITITRVKLDREMVSCKVYWSVLGGEKDRQLNEHMLNHAARFIQHEVAGVLHTRTTPRIHFVYDESITGALRIDNILRELRAERQHKGTEDADEATGETESDTTP